SGMIRWRLSSWKTKLCPRKLLRPMPRDGGDSAAAIMELGRFFWLMHPGRPNEPQYVVAVWSPNINHDGPLELLDMVVFFSPHTAGYGARYPFGLFGLLPDPKA